jgi:hypothetical protein
MPRHRIGASARLRAPATVVYRVIADYRQHHPNILPPAFSNLLVQEGGVGAGTSISFDLKAAGRTRHYRGIVSEPEPGRLLVEAYPEERGETSFLVEPDGDGCRVTIATDFETRSGLAGKIEGWLAGVLLRPVYADELRRLEAYALQIGQA